MGAQASPGGRSVGIWKHRRPGGVPPALYRPDLLVYVTPMSAPLEWPARPVFISSTFKDMHAERDWLGNHVFPQLEEELKKRHHHLETIDLRLGVETVEEASDLPGGPRHPSWPISRVTARHLLLRLALHVQLWTLGF